MDSSSSVASSASVATVQHTLDRIAIAVEKVAVAVSADQQLAAGVVADAVGNVAIAIQTICKPSTVPGMGGGNDNEDWFCWWCKRTVCSQWSQRHPIAVPYVIVPNQIVQSEYLCCVCYYELEIEDQIKQIAAMASAPPVPEEDSSDGEEQPSKMKKVSVADAVENVVIAIQTICKPSTPGMGGGKDNEDWFCWWCMRTVCSRWSQRHAIAVPYVIEPNHIVQNEYLCCVCYYEFEIEDKIKQMAAMASARPVPEEDSSDGDVEEQPSKMQKVGP